ncbi:MAG: hypothetical protein QOE23_1287 [Pseudonocardiales bacterium]|nr:hypothetical protein [Pseudonocardiales bacterium]
MVGEGQAFNLPSGEKTVSVEGFKDGRIPRAEESGEFDQTIRAAPPRSGSHDDDPASRYTFLPPDSAWGNELGELEGFFEATNGYANGRLTGRSATGVRTAFMRPPSVAGWSTVPGHGRPAVR